MEAGNGRRFAVVTGASSGIGLELANVFAEEGWDLLINAEDEDIEAVRGQLAESGVDVQAVRADLTSGEDVDRLWSAIKDTGRPLDAIVLNAGIGSGGDFARQMENLHQELEIVDLNVRSVVHLAKHALNQMVERDHGRVLITSSVASTIPGSFHAVYNASKSFVQSFALALQEELKDSEVTVTSLMPGATETEFFERADMEDTSVGQGDKDDPAQVARQGYEALMSGEAKVVGGSFSNKVQVAAGRVVPDTVKAKMHRDMAQPGSGEDE
jgi:uncharacterized protein